MQYLRRSPSWPAFLLLIVFVAGCTQPGPTIAPATNSPVAVQNPTATVVAQAVPATETPAAVQTQAGANPTPTIIKFVYTEPTQRPAVTAAADTTMNQVLFSLLQGYKTTTSEVAVPTYPKETALAAMQALVDTLHVSGQDRDTALNTNWSDDLDQNSKIIRDSFKTLFSKYGKPGNEWQVAYAMLRAMAHSVKDCHTYFLDPEEYKQWQLGIADYRQAAPELLNNLPYNAIGLEDDGPLSYQILPNKIGYVRISSFARIVATNGRKSLSDQFTDALTAFDAQGITDVIIDVRDNGGGDPIGMAAIAGNFIPAGEKRPVDFTRNAAGRETPEYLPDDTWSHRWNLAVLVNGHSYSAAEILPLALKDYGVATLVGTKTSGCIGVTQGTQMLDGSSLQYTEAVVLSPLTKKSLNQVGITPDIVVPMSGAGDAQRDAAINYLLKKRSGG